MKTYVFKAMGRTLAEIHASHLSKESIKAIKKALWKQYIVDEEIEVYLKLTEISYRQVES